MQHKNLAKVSCYNILFIQKKMGGGGVGGCGSFTHRVSLLPPPQLTIDMEIWVSLRHYVGLLITYRSPKKYMRPFPITSLSSLLSLFSSISFLLGEASPTHLPHPLDETLL